jgi:hypothetical protein
MDSAGNDAAAGPALIAGSAALRRELSEPVQLAGSDRSVVLRCADGRGSTVVVKTYPRENPGPACFAAEAAGLATAHGTGLAPELLAADIGSLTVVMSDLGSGPSLADVLLGEAPAADARATLLEWARSCGELSAATTSRMADFETALSRYLAGGPDLTDAATLPGLILRASERTAALTSQPVSGLRGVRVPAGVDAELRAVARAVSPVRFPVFSPGDICPDNNLLTAGGIRFLDFESAGIYCAFLDAAYIRMPFSTCWCVFRLPVDIAAAAEAAYREQIIGLHPALADDGVWADGVRSAVAAWSLSSFGWLLRRAVEGDDPMLPGRVSPSTRQLIRYRWQILLAELEPAGDLPALAELTRSLLAATAHWQAVELPVYPAFRAPG